MSRIVSAINSMINNAGKITKVIPSEGVYYFLYADKYKWSIIKYADDSYYLNYFPGELTIEKMAELSDYDWNEMNIENVRYSTDDLKAKEAYESFRELFLIVKEKLFGVDQVLDDIIEDDDGLPF